MTRQITFKIMYNASDYALRAVLQQSIEKKPTTIGYASKTLVEAYMNHTMVEKKFLAVLYALNKFRLCILGSGIIIYIDHVALKILALQEGGKATTHTMRATNHIQFIHEFT